MAHPVSNIAANLNHTKVVRDAPDAVPRTLDNHSLAAARPPAV